jgi:two-component system chemotaxis sensor kinase CheA
MDQALFQSIWPVFVEEARDLLRKLGGSILELEKAGGPEAVDAACRVAHSLKGSASSMELVDIEQVAHALEDVLASFKAQGRLPREQAEGALRAVVLMEEALKLGDEGKKIQIDEKPAMMDTLKRLVSAGPGAAAAAAKPSPRGPGVESLAQLEDVVGVLCSPPEGDSHATAVARGLTAAEALGALAVTRAPGNGQKIVGDMVAALKVAAAGGPGVTKAAVSLADLCIALKPLLTAAPAVVAAPAAPAAVAPAPAAPPPPAAAEPAPELTGGSRAQDKTVRVSTRSLDSLSTQIEHVVLGRAREERRLKELREIGENLSKVSRLLATTKQAVEELPELDESSGLLSGVQRDLGLLIRQVEGEVEQLQLTSAVVKDDLRELRTAPAASLLDSTRLVVRDVCARLGKEVSLSIQGEQVRLDRRILGELKEPLLHLIRNAIDHGLEGAPDRRAAGKSEVGSLRVMVEQRGSRVAVHIQDDGRGISAEKVRAAAIRKGILNERDAAGMDEQALQRLIFAPGFSTAESVTAVSGRGVGLDVVAETVNRLGGTVQVDSQLGKGTTFSLDLPLTLAATRALVVLVGLEHFAVPFDAVERLIRLKREDLGTVAGRTMVALEDVQIPFASLAQSLNRPSVGLAIERGEHQPAVVLNVGGGRVAFAVDKINDQQEIVVHSLGRRSGRLLVGVTVLEDGNLVPVLNTGELVRTARPTTRSAAPNLARTRIVICDDSITTRSMMKSVLELAGFEVLAGSDGQMAFELIEKHGCSLVVSDVQMPRLDGLGLCRKIRADSRFARLPLILVTSLDSDEDKAAGLEAGASGYLVKREVERGKLLDLARQLLSGDA